MDNVIQFRPRPNPRREAEQMAEQFGQQFGQAMVNAMCWPWLAWADQFNQFDAGVAELYAKGLALDTAPSEYCAPVDDSA